MTPTPTPHQVDSFAIGRNWWWMPIFIAFVQVLATGMVQLVSDFHGEKAIDWWVLAILFFAGPTVGAILISPDCRCPQCFTAVASCLFGVLVFRLFDNVTSAFFILSIGLAVILSAWMRWTRTPPYRIRPSRRSGNAGMSIRWLLVFTAIMAALITGLRTLNLNGELPRIIGMFLPSCFAMALGSWLAASRSAQTRWLVVALGFVLLTLAYLAQTYAITLGIDTYLPHWFMQLDDKEVRLLLVAPAATLVITTTIHRCQVQVNLLGRRCRSK
ncbi:hypothetical protein N9N28_00165 [Rubripirellula amarantea]|nr:hypothetical protein [Rubripirellula amarantea]